MLSGDTLSMKDKSQYGQNPAEQGSGDQFVSDQEQTRATAAEPGTTSSGGEDAEQNKDTAKEVGDRVRQKAGEATEKAKEQGRSFLNDQKERVASEISAYSEAARKAADRLEAESDTNLSGYVSSAADHLDRLGKRIEERSLDGLVDDVEDMARQRPEVFYGGMFVAGLAAARFLKASKRRRRRESTDFSSPYEPRSASVGTRSEPFSTPGASTGSFSPSVSSAPPLPAPDQSFTGGNI